MVGRRSHQSLPDSCAPRQVGPAGGSAALLCRQIAASGNSGFGASGLLCNRQDVASVPMRTRNGLRQERVYTDRAMRVALQLGAAVRLPAALLPASNVMDEIRQGSFARPTPAPQHLNVLDWNIDRGTQLDRIAAAMEAQQPGLMILQEVDLNARRSNRVDVAQELAKRLSLNYVFAPEFQELGQGSSDDPAYHGQIGRAS